MQSKLVRITNWLTYTLLGLAGGWLIFGKALAPGGWPLRLSKDPGELPAKEHWIIPSAKDPASAHDTSPLLVSTKTTAAKTKSPGTPTSPRLRRLPVAALIDAGLTEADRPKAETILDQAWKDMESLLTERVRPGTDPGAKEGEKVYFISGDQASGDAVLVQMRKQLREAFGKEAADAMLAGMHIEDYFAAFGRRDVKITVPSSLTDALIGLAYSDPATGHPLMLTAADAKRFKEIFGEIIPLP
ncbi:hypothetical protein [Haloferula sp. BvORR071]|uniref:hypothetical protein n=1 Tax=Haloferula sp. BvORR071 TaxID=1396141 RepID=UPI00054ED46F|nr:hypothetical protein [Haloferula sp. BvORR071]